LYETAETVKVFAMTSPFVTARGHNGRQSAGNFEDDLENGKASMPGRRQIAQLAL